jgi:hypothetical protein
MASSAARAVEPAKYRQSANNVDAIPREIGVPFMSMLP